MTAGCGSLLWWCFKRHLHAMNMAVCLCVTVTELMQSFVSMTHKHTTMRMACKFGFGVNCFGSWFMPFLATSDFAVATHVHVVSITWCLFITGGPHFCPTCNRLLWQCRALPMQHIHIAEYAMQLLSAPPPFADGCSGSAEFCCGHLHDLHEVYWSVGRTAAG